MRTGYKNREGGTEPLSMTLKMHYSVEKLVFIVKEYVKSKSIQPVRDSFSETGRFFERHPV